MTGMYATVGIARGARESRRRRERRGRIHRSRDARRAGRVPRESGDELSRLGQAADARTATNIPTSSRRTCSAAATAISGARRAATTDSFVKLCRSDRPCRNWRDDRASRPTRRACTNLAGVASVNQRGSGRQTIWRIWLAKLDAAAVPCGPINTIPMVFDDAAGQAPRDAASSAASCVGHGAAGGEPAASAQCAARLRPRAADARPAHRRSVARTWHRSALTLTRTGFLLRGLILARVPLFSPDSMTPEQERVYRAVVDGPRGTVVGPLRAALHRPELADRWQRFGEILRFGTSLPAWATELAIVVTARRWNSQLEWHVHARAAASAGDLRGRAGSRSACGGDVALRRSTAGGHL